MAFRVGCVPSRLCVSLLMACALLQLSPTAKISPRRQTWGMEGGGGSSRGWPPGKLARGHQVLAGGVEAQEGVAQAQICLVTRLACLVTVARDGWSRCSVFPLTRCLHLCQPPPNPSDGGRTPASRLHVRSVTRILPRMRVYEVVMGLVGRATEGRPKSKLWAGAGAADGGGEAQIWPLCSQHVHG